MNNSAMSPLLRNRIQSGNPNANQNGADLNYVYENLKLRANEAKPNEAKAKLVNDNFIKRQTDAIKDTGKDCANFVKAVKTADVNDTQLGRINDIGMKVGAALIAAFLALNAKNKKTAVMEFVGAATFLTSMAAWPKLFINLPAKLVHGFDIDKKYISAQGEKKDFFLDNQFLPWDIYSKEELTEIGKNTGIDINSPNGEEKIKRKMQKTALQNRTLWMATAGFATPLMTSMACSVAEPYIEKGIIKSDFNKVRKLTEANGVKSYIDSIQAKSGEISKSQAELNKLFEGHQKGVLGENFFDELASKLGLSSLSQEFKNADDLKVIAEFESNTALVDELKSLYKNSASYDSEDLLKALSSLNVKSQGMEALGKEEIQALSKKLGGGFTHSQLVKELLSLGCDPKQVAKLKHNSVNAQTLFDILGQVPLKSANGAKTLTQEQLKNMLGDGPLTIGRVRQLLSNPAQFNQKEVEQILENVKVDNSEFIETIKTFDRELGANTRAKVAKFMKLVNPVAGERSLSVYTKEYMDTVNTLFKEMGLTDGQIRALISENPQVKVPEVLKDFFKGKAQNQGEYKTFIEDLYRKVQTPDEVANVVKSLTDNASSISSDVAQGSKFKGLMEAMLGEGKQSCSLVNSIKSFLGTGTTNIETFKSKLLLMSGLERRIQSGELAQAFKDNGLVSEAFSIEQLTKLAREAIYSSSSSNAANKFGMPNAYKIFRDIVFDKNAYDIEKGVSKQAAEGIEKAIEFMTKEGSISKETYLGASNFASQIKTIARSLNNNKIWKKIFVTGTIALAAVTLLVQPLFGNIKKEYPENNKAGNNK